MPVCRELLNRMTTVETKQEFRCRKCNRLLFTWGTGDPSTYLEFRYLTDEDDCPWIEVKCKGGICGDTSRIRIDTVHLET